MFLERTSFRLFTLLLLLLLGANTAVYAKRDAHWQQYQYIYDSFLRIALQREYAQLEAPRLVRWQKPIRIFFESDVGDRYLQAKLLSVHTQHLSNITGVPISFTENIKRSNIIISFTSKDQMEEKVWRYIGNPDDIRQALDEAICLGNFGVSKQGEIQRGVIIIPVNYARQNARFLDCIVEEITQLMGLPNDSDDVYPSIFNDVSSDIYLSPLDYILLKILYSPKLQAGMNVRQVEQVLGDTINDMIYRGTIEDAVELVQKGSLKTYLGD